MNNKYSTFPRETIWNSVMGIVAGSMIGGAVGLIENVQSGFPPYEGDQQARSPREIVSDPVNSKIIIYGGLGALVCGAICCAAGVVRDRSGIADFPMYD